MITIDLADEVRRLMLQLERDVVARARLRQLLTTTDLMVSGNREQLRALRAQLKRSHAKR